MEAAALWDAADTAALEAACANWPEGRARPDSARLQLVTDPETQLVDRNTALAMLRSRIEHGAAQHEWHDSAVTHLAWIAAADIEDTSRAQERVDAVTLAFTALELAGFSPEEPIEPKQRAAMTALEDLQRAMG